MCKNDKNTKACVIKTMQNKTNRVLLEQYTNHTIRD